MTVDFVTTDEKGKRDRVAFGVKRKLI